jgi:hypothetical protein
VNKNAVYLAFFAVFCVLAGVIVGAQVAKERRPNYPSRMETQRRSGRLASSRAKESPEKKDAAVESLSASLGLSAEQKEQVSKIFEDARQEITQAGKYIRDEIKQIKEETNAEIIKVLNAVQQEKFRKLQEGIKQRVEAAKVRDGE